MPDKFGRGKYEPRTALSRDEVITSLVLVVVSLLLLFLTWAVRPPTARKPATVDVPRVRALEAWYRSYDARFFAQPLPKARVHSLEDDRFSGLTEYEEVGDYYDIGINFKLNPTGSEQRLTLLHEMCHVSLRGEPEFDQHGPKFQACMLALAREGAFNDLW